MESEQINGAKAAYYGLTFRKDDDENYYFFRVRDDRYFDFLLRYKEEWTTLIDWTKTSAIKPDDVNRLTVTAEGSHFSFYINNELVAEFDDSQLSDGEVGLAIGLSNADDEAVSEFDNFEVRVP